MKLFFLLACFLAVGCGESAGKSKKPLVIVTNNATNNSGTNNATNTGTNNDTNTDCCAGLRCGGSPNCEGVVCGTCEQTSFCNDAQQCEVLAADGPRIIDLSINTSTATPTTTLTISAIVTDPDGIDDLIGGTLKSISGASYGAFQTSAAEGSYQLNLTWTQLNAVEPIVFDAPISREIIAEFYDQAGHKVQRSLTLTLACDIASGAACDAGKCVDLDTNEEHCGACGNALGESIACEQGKAVCSEGDYCAGEGICSASYSPLACGECSNNCEEKAALLGFTFVGDSELYCIDSTCDARLVSRVAVSCNTLCGAATCTSSRASFFRDAFDEYVRYEECDTDWTDRSWVDNYGALQDIECRCEF